MKQLLGLLVAAALAPVCGAADIEAGKAKATQVCAACHGANGVSVSDTIPNLAAQRSAYIEAQLKAFKEGTRRAAAGRAARCADGRLLRPHVDSQLQQRQHA